MNRKANGGFLRPLLESSKRLGWAVGEVPLGHLSGRAELATASIQREAAGAGLVLAPNRAGEGMVSTLIPLTEDDAHPASLSAEVGLGRQPFHTDGAHLRKVPDVVLLWALHPSKTPTLVWFPNVDMNSDDAAGIFLIEPGGEPFLAPAVESRSLRFDPVCMSPADARARRIAQLLQPQPDADIKSITWDKPCKMLAIRNRRLLHARAAVVAGDTDRKIYRAAFYEGV